MEYPLTFEPSRRAPSKKEMDWLHNWIKSKSFPQNSKILEFGCGITTWVISDAIGEYEKYLCVENFEPCINKVKQHVKKVDFISTSWADIPKEPYNLVFVDASSCPPKNLKSIIPGATLFRDDAINYVINFTSDDCVFIIHDWCYKLSWLRPQKYFTELNYKLIDCLKTRHGIGIYQKGVFTS